MVMNENKRCSRKLSYETVFNTALHVFCNDKDKTTDWWMRKSPDFDNLSPFEMVKNGKGQKLLKILLKCK